MTKLYAMKTEFKTPQQLAREAVSDYRTRHHLPSLESVTVREGAGMHCLPSTFRSWWNAPLEHKPVPGEVQASLYGKRK